MAEFIGDINRKLVPRWRSSEMTTSLGELTGPLRSPIESYGVDDFDEKVSNWRSSPTVSSAAELLAAGFVHSRLEETREAAEFIVRYAPPRFAFLRDMAFQVVNPFQALDPDDEQTQEKQIRSHREILTVEPRNPLKWVDLARNFLLIGRAKKASRAMQTALQLAPDDRFVLRSATRLYLHLREPEKAYYILSVSEAVQDDPALVGPEIAVSSLVNRTSRLMRRGIRLLESKDHSESQLSELAAVIATEELRHGAGRKVRQLFTKSLLKPNENIVAQVRWAASKTDSVLFDPRYLLVDRSFEARAWTNFFNGDWRDAFVQSKSWLKDQGFSRRPAALGSFIAAVTMEDHLEAIAILRRGLISNPNEPLLLNNLAYSLACLGKTQEAEQYLQRIAIRSDDPARESLSITKAATAGLVEYRKGNSDLGRALYRKAHESALASGQERLRGRVVMFFALEEVRAGMAVSDPGIQSALEAGEKASDPLLQLLAKRLRNCRRAGKG